MSIIALLYYLVALIAALILLNAYKKGTTIGKKIGKVMLATFLLVVFYSFQLTADNATVRSYAMSMFFIVTDIMLILFYDYILEFISWNKKVPKAVLYCMYIGAGVDMVFFLLNPYNQMTVSYIDSTFADTHVLTYIPNPPFYYHTIFVVVMIMIVAALLILKCGETPRVYWKRYYMLIFGILLAVAVNLMNLYQADFFVLDLSSVLYCFIGMLMYYNTFRYLPAVTMNITRRMILNYLSEPVILFDYDGWLTDYSKSILKVMPNAHFIIGSMTIDEFVSSGNFIGFRPVDTDQDFDWTTRIGGEDYTYSIKYRCMTDAKGRSLGKIFVFHDITSMRDTYFNLEKSLLYDPLTGLYNKQSYLQQVPQWDNKRYWPVAVAVCNINGLKRINDQYGIEYGDAVMKQLAYFVKMHAGEDAYVAKLEGGDILAVLEETTHNEAVEICEDIKKDLEGFYGRDLLIHLEYGVAVKEDAVTTMEQILGEAKSSMQNKKMLRDNSMSSSLVDSLKQTLSESDYETEEHVERTREMASRLGKALNLSDTDIGKLELLAIMHDIGKVAIPHQVLLKKGKLSDEEFEIMKQHTIKGYRIANASPELSSIADCILSHHEKWDGTGYPNKLKGEDIPLLARIISAVDSHDVMVHDRPYHRAMPEEDAIKELRRCAGTQFDPNIIVVFTRLLEEEELPKIQKAREAAAN
ncbi:MAG: HD domain-containing protein [Lachnospiraceae bacterium]|nr:HD domain-containing protein [Lachnospiraceae bacterium]